MMHRLTVLFMSSAPPYLCEDLRNFLTTFVFITAESVQATLGSKGIMIMSVDIGSRLWDELEEEFSDCASSRMQISERLDCFLSSLVRTGLIADFSFVYEGGCLKITINNCFFVQASNRQKREGMEYPLCPMGGLIVAGLHRNAGMLTTLEKIEHDPHSGSSTLTLDLHPPRAL